MRQTRSQWLSRFFPVVNLLSRFTLVKPPTPPKPLPQWRVMMECGDVVVAAQTKSEARARAKELFHLDRLPSGTQCFPLEEVKA